MPGLIFLGFWIFMSVAAVAGIVADYKKRQLSAARLYFAETS